MHLIHALLLVGALRLFLDALLSDYAYASNYEIQWKNFASWLLVGVLVLVGLALLSAIIDLLRGDDRRGRRLI